MNLKFLETLKDKHFILCNPNSDELMIIQHRDEKLNIWLNDIWDLSFTVDNLNTDGNEDNLFYPLIIKDRIIKIQDVGEFVITNTQENDNGISKSKQVSCNSLEHNITKKSISYLECKAYKFYDIIPENIPDTFMGIIMSYLPNWTIAHIDTELYNLYRIFDISSDTSIYNLLIENAQAAYECLFQFDRLNKTLSAYTRDNIIKETDIFISFDNLVKELDISPINDGLCTSLSVSGANDMSINLVNPLGTNVIYNLDNVIDSIDDKTGIRLMTLDTAGAWKNWKAQYDVLKLSYADNLISIKDKKSQILMLQAQLDNINAQIKALNSSIASFDTLEEDKSDLVNQYNAKLAEKDGIEHSITELKSDIKVLEDELYQTNSSLKFSNFFSPAQLKELDNFIIIGSYSDENFAVTDSMTDVDVIEMTQELFDKASRQLDILSKNRYSFDIDMLCPFFTDNFLSFKNQLDLGCQITLRDSKNNYYYPLLIGISVSFDKLSDVSFTFSESLKNQNEQFNLSQLLGKTANVATNLSMNNLKYNSYVDSGDKESLRKLRTEALNADVNSVINSSNQEIIIDDTGILGRKILGNGNYDSKQYRFTNQQLLFTDDAWKHAKLGIGNITLPNGQKAYGINGEVILGDMLIGNNLGIHNANNSFIVDENGATLINSTLSITGNEGKNKMLLDPVNGFKIQKKNGNLFTDMVFLNSDGEANFNGNIFGGSININNKFKVNADGTVEMAVSTLKSFQSLMSNGKGFKVNDGISNIDGDCIITGNLVVRGNTTLGGNITWEVHDTKFDEYSNTFQMNSAIKASADGITSTVSSQINGINQNITTIRQTSDSIALAVNNNKLVFNSSGLSIYNAGFKIYNGSTEVFGVSSNGYIRQLGEFYNASGSNAVRIYNGNIEIACASSGSIPFMGSSVVGNMRGTYTYLNRETLYIDATRNLKISTNYTTDLYYGMITGNTGDPLGATRHHFQGNIAITGTIYAFGKFFKTVKTGSTLTSSDYVMVSN